MADGARISFPNGCPRCRRGPIVSGFWQLNERCSNCQLSFVRESGQHLGAAALAYMMGAVVALPIFFVLLLGKSSPLVAVGVPALVLAGLAPINVRLSRQLWTHILYMLNS